MGLDLQKGSVWKRIAAWILDVILVCILVTGIAWALSAVLGYDGYNTTLNNAYKTYEDKYGITFEITGEAYQALPEADRLNYDAAYQELIKDDAAMHAYNMVLNLTMLITTVSIMLAVAIVEFVVPLLLKNGQTVGKKVFGLGVVRIDAVKANTVQLFIRAILGKYTIGTMLPVFLILMIFFNMIGSLGTTILLILLLVQVGVPIINRNNAGLHDLLAGTVVVDVSSQKIFPDTQSLIDYKKKLHAEQAARQDY